MSDVLGFVPDDGYTERGVIRAVPGLFPRVEFTFRPALSEERMDYHRAMEKAKPDQAARLAAAFLVGHLKEWDLKDARGAAAPVNAATAARLKDRLFLRLLNAVLGNEPPDESPDQSAEDAEALLADTLKATERGCTVAQVREERGAKN